MYSCQTFNTSSVLELINEIVIINKYSRWRMSIAIHLSVYLRYLDSINRPLLQYIIELINGSYLQTFNKYSDGG